MERLSMDKIWNGKRMEKFERDSAMIYRDGRSSIEMEEEKLEIHINFFFWQF